MNIWLVRVFGPEVAKTSVPDHLDIISTSSRGPTGGVGISERRRES